MKLLTKEIRKQLPPIGAQDQAEDPTVYVKFFCPWNHWTWFGYEFDQEETVTGGSRIPLFLDCIYVDSFPHHTDSPMSDVEYAKQGQDPRWDLSLGEWSWNAMRMHSIDRHKGGINGVFLDMSARKIGLKELWKLKWHKNYDTGNAWTRGNPPWPDWMRKFSK